MKPSANLYRQHLSHQFNKANLEFLESLHFFNPEGQIVKLFKESLGEIKFKNNLNELKDATLERLILWRAVTAKGATTEILYDLQSLPFRNSLKDLIDNIDGANFQQYLKSAQPISGKLINYKFEKIRWFIKMDSIHNSYVPNFVPKRLYLGLRIDKTEDRLTVCFQSASHSIWVNNDYNSTKVIPITHENFERVLNWHAEEAKIYLQNKEQNNA